MIIVLLLFFQSICLYCQRLVLHVYDRWINPKNVRLLKEAAELTGNRKLLQQPIIEPAKRNRKRYTTSASGTVSESCNFCANTPKGFCRHHLYLKELEIQKQQQRSWNPLSERESEYKVWRKANRELKRNLKNRFFVHQQQQEQSQQQLRRQTRLQNLSSEAIYAYEPSSNSGGDVNVVANDDGGGSSIDINSSNSSILYADSGYHSASCDTTTTPPTSSSPSGIEPVETVYYFEPILPPSSSGSSSSLLSAKLSGGSYARSLAVPVSVSTSYL